jgi:hypothetical protein
MLTVLGTVFGFGIGAVFALAIIDAITDLAQMSRERTAKRNMIDYP